MKTGTKTARCVFPVADIVERPQAEESIGKGESQLLFGERFEVTKEEEHWLYGCSLHDGYNGYIRKDCLEYERPGAQDTHFVSSLSALVYPKPDFKTRPLLNLSFLSRLSITDKEESGFLWAAGAGWIPSAHVLPVRELKNPVAPLETASMFLNAPYRYGGRLAWGIYCSALVQLALMRNGISCPRDSGEQAEIIADKVGRSEAGRGDLVFFPGHVGIMTDRENVLNASARTMSVRVEKLEDLEKIYGKALCFRNMSRISPPPVIQPDKAAPALK